MLVVKEVGRYRHTSKCRQFSGSIQKERVAVVPSEHNGGMLGVWNEWHISTA